jgi:hypothetical protein
VYEEESEEGETYTWSGQTRIRACSLLEEGYAGLDGYQSSKPSKADEDQELDIVGEDDVFGSAQYPHFNSFHFITC